MYERINSGKNREEIEVDGKAGKAVGQRVTRLAMAIMLLASVAIAVVYFAAAGQAQSEQSQGNGEGFNQPITANALPVLEDGKQIFRFDTFGDEAFWGDTLKLHRAIEGTKFGGVGAGVSPQTSLAVGLKVDMDALPADLVDKIKQGQVNLDDPATTLVLIKLNSVLGLQGQFNQDGRLRELCWASHDGLNSNDLFVCRAQTSTFT